MSQRAAFQNIPAFGKPSSQVSYKQGTVRLSEEDQKKRDYLQRTVTLGVLLFIFLIVVLLIVLAMYNVI
jgi:hypothetical protein